MKTTPKRRGSQGMAVPTDWPGDGRPDCGVIAVAVAANVPYAKAWQTLRAVWDRSGRWKGRTTRHERAMAMKRLGKAHPKPVTLPKGMTVKMFLADHAVPSHWYWVQTGQHIATCVKEGGQTYIVDNMPDHTRFMRCRVKSVWRLH